MNSIPLPTVLGLFAELFSHELAERWLQSQSSEPSLSRPRGFYRRIFSLVVTLWYLIFQRLNADKTQDAVVKDARRGGADRFSPSRRERLSKKIRSNATTSYSDARQRMPLAFLQWALRRIGEHVQEGLRQSGVALRSFQLIDGSTLPVLWNPSLGKAYPPALNQHGRSDWCLMRVVVGFCALPEWSSAPPKVRCRWANKPWPGLSWPRRSPGPSGSETATSESGASRLKLSCTIRM
jgi:hypothetical protein